MSSSRYVCFDFDGTLIDSRQDIADAVNELRDRYDLEPLEVETVTDAIGGGAWVLIDETLPDTLDPSTEELLEEFRPIYRAICADKVRPYGGITELIHTLRNDRLSIVTNKPLDMTEKILDRLGWNPHFQPVFGADSFELMKPDPKPLRAVVEKWEINPDQLTMIGDSWTDVQAGNKLGCRTIACLYGLGKSEETLDESPDETVESVQQLHEVLQEQVNT